MSVREVMSELGISRDSLYRRIKNGSLTPLPKDNPVRYKEPLRFDRAQVMAVLALAQPKDQPKKEG